MKPRKCQECGGSIPKKAKICPRCKADLRQHGGLVGKISSTLFWGFNALMLILHIFFWIENGSKLNQSSTVTNFGESIGTVILGSGEIIGYWLLGVVILGLLVLLSRPD